MVAIIAPGRLHSVGAGASEPSARTLRGVSRYERFVAIGDSTVEGLDDPDGRGGYRGWSNRLAERLAREQGSVLYANLAIRGRTTRQIRDEQLAPALAMRPDLAAVVGGTNDVLRRSFDAAVFQSDLTAMFSAFTSTGATVITFTLPDLTPVMPIARMLRGRVLQMAEAIRAACRDSGAICCDLAAHPVASDPRLWSADRLHANSAGHARIAEALAAHLGLPGVTDRWADPLDPPLPPRSVAGLLRAEAEWIRTWLAPWVWRHLHGRSSGDGRSAKRPALTPLTLESESQE
jgi:lysophospholipase L1-like esterase